MGSRTAARGRSKLPARPSSSSFGIWISDYILSETIKRYQRKSSTQCRYLSSRPGPLESRRRLGRRGMTGLMPRASDYPPFWNFDVQVPNTWRWQPPTAAKDRHSKKTQRTLGDRLIAWLEDAQADKPFLAPPTDLEMAEADLEAMSLEAVPEEVVLFRQRIMALDTVTEVALREVLDDCVSSLVYRIENGFLSASAIAASLDLFNAASKVHIASATLEATALFEYRRSLLNATTAWFAREPQAFTLEGWTTLLKKLVSLSVRREDANARFFRYFLARVPESMRHQIPAAEIFPFVQAMVATHSSRDPFTRSSFAFAGKFASPLKKLSMTQLLEIDKLMTGFLNQNSLGPATQEALGYSWMLLKAFHPAMSQQILTDGWKSGHVYVNALHKWQLCIAHLVSIDFIDKAMRDELLQASGNGASRWAHTIMVVRSQSPRALSELCQFLTDVGQLVAVVDELTRHTLNKYELQATRFLAEKCSDTKVRLQLLGHIEHTSGKVDYSVWTWSQWLSSLQHAHAERDSEGPLLHLLHKLSACHISTRSRDLTSRDRLAVSKLLSDLSSHYLTTPGLTDRQRLRRIELCIRSSRLVGHFIPPQLLADVTKLLVRDLEQGNGGRQTRHRWLFKLLSSSSGVPAQAQHVKSLIRGWRRTNKGLTGGQT